MIQKERLPMVFYLANVQRPALEVIAPVQRADFVHHAEQA